MKNSDDSTEKASRFSAIPADFLLSYGGLDGFEKGLTALVGPPVANAALLEKAVHDEHKNDKDFRMWSNKFKKEYEVNHVLEYNYCQGPARECGHEQYRQAIQPDIDLNRDTGQDGRTVEAFMQKYVVELIALMQSAHDANLAACLDGKLGNMLQATWENVQVTRAELFSNMHSRDSYEQSYNHPAITSAGLTGACGK